MIKTLNLRNLIILVVVLAVIHFGVGLVVSPLVSPLIIGKINQLTGAKLYIERANIWPLTLSLSLKGLKVFDPENSKQRIAVIGEASVYLSPLGLLSKRIVLSRVLLNRARINLVGEPDGTFNIQKLAQAKKSAEEKAEAPKFKITKEKMDWFGKVYGILKKELSKDALEKQKARREAPKQISKDITDLPKGRRVHFKTTAERYLLEIKNLEIKNAYLNLISRYGRPVALDKARIILKGVGYDPELGSRIGRLDIAGNIKNESGPAGSLKFNLVRTLNKEGLRIEFDIGLKDVNLNAVRFIYEESLPVIVQKGTLNLNSKSILINDNIDSRNELVLSNHTLAPKAGVESAAEFMPVPIICNVLNNINPVKLNFEITGTLEEPEFRGFMKSLMEIVKPNFKNIAESFKSALGDYLQKKKKKQDSSGAPSEDSGKKTDAQDVIDSLQSIFGGKKKDDAQ